jgi:DNA/RNA endonuclease YhcR with UshA esterase domain
MTEPIMHRSAASPGRSPLTQAGELFEQPVPLDTDGEEQPEAPDGPVPWDEAHEYVGQVITAEGEIVRTNEITTRGGEGDRITFLNFADDWRGTFTVVIHERYYDDFPPNLGTFYDGKTLRVTGLVTEHRGSPQIEPESSDQVEVLAD